MKRVLRILPLGDLVASRSWGALVATLVPIALVAALPFVAPGLVNIALFVAVYAILALGLNVVVGYTGLLDLGYVTFLATGAVVTVDLLLLAQTPEGLALVEASGATRVLGFHGSIFIIMGLAGLICALGGVLRGIPTLRLTGDYYAIVTLGLAEILYLVFLNGGRLTGGAFGTKLTLDTRPALPWLEGGQLAWPKLYHDEPVFYVLVMGTLGLTVLVMDRLNRSRVGRAWAAIRLDETAARACGVNVSRYKMIAFAISGFVGGIGGSLYAIWNGTVAVKALDIWQSILILCAVVLGGMGSIRGVLVGSVILFSLRELLREKLVIFGMSFRVPPEASFLIYGLLLIFIMRFRPQGMVPRGKGESVRLTAEEEAALWERRPALFTLDEEAAKEADRG